jgi:hypothetical protein
VARRRLLEGFCWGGAALFTVAALAGCSSESSADANAEALVEGHAVFDVVAWNQQFTDSEGAAQQLVAECMQEAGFDYVVPVPDLGFKDEAVSALESESLTDGEFASSFGYGVSTLQDFGMGSSDEELAAENETAPEINPGAVNLPGPEQVAFQRTLYGTSSSDQGCLSEGYEDHSEWSNGINDKYDDIDRRQQAFLADPRVSDYYTGWTACMSGAGFGNAIAPMQVQISLTADMRSILESRNDLELQELNQFEREIGVATVDCGESSQKLLPPELISVWNSVYS